MNYRNWKMREMIMLSSSTLLKKQNHSDYNIPRKLVVVVVSICTNDRILVGVH
jgi:hypothetical protein